MSSKLSSKNPLYEKCLMELLSESSGEYGRKVYQKCLDSLRKYPLRLESVTHCRILEGFGKKVVSKLEKKVLDISDPVASSIPKSVSILDIHLSPLRPIPSSQLNLSKITSGHLARNYMTDNPFGVLSSSQVDPIEITLDDSEEELKVPSEYSSDCDTLCLPSPEEKNNSELIKRSFCSKIEEFIPKKATKMSVSPVPMDNDSDVEELENLIQSKTKSILFQKNTCDSTFISNHFKDKIHTTTPVCDSIDDELLSLPSPITKDESENYSMFCEDEVISNKVKQNSHSTAPIQFISDDSDEELENSKAKTYNSEKKPVIVSSQSSKSYLPKYRSGAYAILLTIYNLFKQNRQDLKKDEIITEAQSLCDDSLTHSHDSSTYYTAWSGVSTLEKKGLVVSKGRPKKFNITESGINTALQLLGENSFTPFKYVYLRDLNKINEETNDQDSAEMDIDNGIYYLIKCTPNSKYSSKIKIKKQLESGLLLAFAHESIVEETSPYKTSKEFSFQSHVEPTKIKTIPKGSKSNNLPVLKTLSVNPRSSLDKCDFRFWLTESPSPIDKPRAQNYRDDCVYDYSFPVGSFDIILIVDVSETAGGRATKREVTSLELKKSNILHDTRRLHVGDFIWIAREKSTQKELVLPYIVERKRIDDLKHSIQDSRYSEQKFRLSNCGLLNKIYLVESYASFEKHIEKISGKGIGLSACEQAIANTSVQDGFFIHRSKNQKESISFLVSMTNALADKYSSFALNSCKWEDLTNEKIKNIETTLMSFDEFNFHSRKTKNEISISQTFMKMLLQQRSLTPNIAWSVAQKFQTPFKFYEAISKFGSAAFDGLKDDAGKKIPAPVISVLCKLFSTPD